MSKKEIFSETSPVPASASSPQAGVTNCIRCGVRCRTVEKSNPDANYFVRGDFRTGKFCTNCLIVDFFKNFDLGPASSLGIDRIESIMPDALRLPHIRAQMARLIEVAALSGGAELHPSEVDWDEVIANWHLPFPEKPKRRKTPKKRQANGTELAALRRFHKTVAPLIEMQRQSNREKICGGVTLVRGAASDEQLDEIVEAFDAVEAAR